MEDNTPILERNGEKYQQLITALGSISLHGANEHLEPGQICSNWERYGAVKDPPRFSEQFSDETRQAPFRYGPAALEKANMGWLATEYEGLQEVRHLLGGHISNARSEDAPMVARAVDMLRNLTFIGEREYDEAVQGIGTAWKAYLDAHPRNQLCVITEINKLDRYEGQRKSDEHLKQRILETFTDISGSHSSVNYGFGSLCSQIVTTAQHYKGRPRLAHVVRSYRDQLPTIEITTDTLRRIPSDELRAHKAILLAGSLTVQEESCR